MENEIWKDIQGYEGYYQVSNLGRIKSLLYRKDRIMIPYKRKGGYCMIHLMQKTIQIHRLVAQAFLGLDINDKNMLVCHKDDNKHNNIVENLFLGTHKDNIQDMIKKGRGKCCRGELSGVSKYKTSDVVTIQEYINKGFRNCEISEITGFNEKFISSIRNKRIWKHVL